MSVVRGTRQEEARGPTLNGALGTGIRRICAGEETGSDESEGRDGGQGVVFLAVGDGEEAEDQAGPEEEGDGSFGCCLLTEEAYLLRDGAGQEGGVGKDPDEEVEPEEPDGGEAVVVGDAFGEEAGDVLVVEVEPGPACAGGEAEAGWHGDGGVAEGGEEVPGEGECEEEDGAGNEVESGEEA